MGTPDFAVPCLQKLIDSDNEITAVFTQPDKKVGRLLKCWLKKIILLFISLIQ